MPRANPLQAALNAGEFSPRLHARVNFDKYPAGAATLQNAIPFTQGGWLRRPGTRYIAEVKDSTAKTYLRKFEFNTVQAYILEFGNNYIRFFKDQGQIVVADTDAAITNGDFPSNITGWTDQSTGSASIAHDATNQRMNLVGAAASKAWAEQSVTTVDSGVEMNLKFEVVGAASDTVKLNIGTTSKGTEIKDSLAYEPGYHCKRFTPTASPFNIQFHHSTAKTLQVDNVSLTDNAGVEIGSPWTTAQIPDLAFAQDGSEMYISHPDVATYRLIRDGHLSWRLEIVLWDDGPYLDENTTSTTLASAATSGLGITITASATTGINDGAGFKSTDVGRLIRITHGANEPGWAVITAFTDTTHVVVDIQRAFNATSAQATWRLGAWSATTGYPRANSFFEQRLALAGTATRPQAFWLSQSADIENMRPDSFVAGATAIEDDDALDFTLAADEVNPILWLSAGPTLLIGTYGGEWTAFSDGPIMTPTDVTALRRTAHGSKIGLRPVRVGQSVLFMQRAGRKLLEFVEVDVNLFRAANMTKLADHITRSGIVEIAYQQEPDALIWCVRADGVLAVLTFQREEDVVGWSRQIIGGSFGSGKAVVESVAVIPGSNGAGQMQDSTDRDEVWITVKRTINGQVKRYVEMVEGIFEGPLRQDYDGDSAWDTAMLAAQRHSYFADSLLTYDGVATSTIAGLDHLEGETVKILADGAEHADRTVSGGQITLAAAASVVQVGLGYTHIFESLKLAAGAAAGTAVGKVKRVHGITLVVLDSAGTELGPSIDDLQTIVLRSGTVPQPLFSGEHSVNFGGPWARDPRLVITSEGPVPFTLLALAPELQTNDLR